jgi:hypothetical protein
MIRSPACTQSNANVTRNNIGIPSTGSESQPARILFRFGGSECRYVRMVSRSHPFPPFYTKKKGRVSFSSTAQPYALDSEEKRQEGRTREKKTSNPKKYPLPHSPTHSKKGKYVGSTVKSLLAIVYSFVPTHFSRLCIRVRRIQNR